MPRTVHCEYEHRDTEGLDFVPWPGELGKRVFAHIGKSAWAKWLAANVDRKTLLPDACEWVGNRRNWANVGK